MALVTAISARPTRFALTAAWKRKNLPKKPAAGGIPPKESKPIVMNSASQGLRRFKPARSLIFYLSVAAMNKITPPKTSKFVKMYINI